MGRYRCRVISRRQRCTEWPQRCGMGNGVYRLAFTFPLSHNAHNRKLMFMFLSRAKRQPGINAIFPAQTIRPSPTRMLPHAATSA